ncbi:hypothetical protein HC766_06870 [Candidatus Gracilibacteria bacterium]|nr:hypothetical protein [Candidatus Gracilibacteria bacterium]
MMEYVTEQLLDRFELEIKSQTLDLFTTHALIKAEAKDYIRESQTRLILAPLADRLLGRISLEKRSGISTERSFVCHAIAISSRSGIRGGKSD